MQELKTYKTKDLILNVNKIYDPTKLDLSNWDRFLDVLCSDRQYQKEAIQTAIIYLASGNYNSIEDLVKENWNDNRRAELKNRYKDIEEYYRKIQLPNKLSATLDLATGTGKSYVIYGIAQIMLGLGLVDKVLVLCPSLTIEKGLKEKFYSLSGDSKIKQSLPETAVYKNPAIVDANSTIKNGDICVENIHAVYENNSSSIMDSLMWAGERVLVLNDEAHHIFNTVTGRDQQSQNIKKWKEFLLGNEYNFKYILGFTGTAYIEDEYFNDVVYRYSLRQAVDDKMVKMIDYVSKDDSIDQNEKFQKILDNHIQNKDTYRKVKPLTILITKDITKAKQLTEELKKFLGNKLDLEKEEVDKKVLIVTSHNDHKLNVAKLSKVDDKEDPTEWIVSVSMLTEGWDVKNVFQIVPWEDRAFCSKLLIAQVLGRGLRVPSEYQSPQPRVRVFNHDAWSRNIRGLVDEILEIEMKLSSTTLENGERSKYHFNLYNIDYDKEQQEKESQKEHQEFDYTKGYLELIAQVEETEKETEYLDLSGRVGYKNTLVQYNTYTIDEIVNKIFDEFRTREWEGKILKLPEGTYTKDNLPPKEEIKKIIRNSMDRVGIKGDRLVSKNKYKIESMFSTLLRKKGKTVVNVWKVTEPYEISTRNVDRETIAVGNLRHNATVFYTDNFESELNQDNKEILQAVIEDETFPRSSSKQINPFLFKTPMDIVFTKYEPERKFIESLCKQINASKLDAWIKSRDQGFYSIEYSITTTGGKHSKQQSFNPDFFIKISENEFDYFIVVEVKSDNDDSDENKAKYKYAKQHFNDLNEILEQNNIKQKYIFHFLSPNSFVEFFDYLRNGKLLKGEFRSDLDDKLEKND
ncbi:DEAD/DEAH box helicase family protein [Bacillota bacterium LX-D]|nr:DEAD/DEAH box helicase family protein [Bacillota bacterium LX-D]